MSEARYATIDETRRERLAHAINSMGSGKKLAEALNLHPSTVSGLMLGRRNISDKTARDIERLMEWPLGLMDTPIDGVIPAALGSGEDEESRLVAYICETIPALSDEGAGRVLEAVTARLAGRESA